MSTTASPPTPKQKPSKAKIIGIAGGPPNNTNEIKTAAEFGVFAGGQQMDAAAEPQPAGRRAPRHQCWDGQR